MNCKAFVEFLMAYLNGELPEIERSEFERHISECPPCVHYLDGYAQAVRMGKIACGDEDMIGLEVPERLVQAVLAARRKGGSAD
jgi:anti-sigma factor RsiW